MGHKGVKEQWHIQERLHFMDDYIKSPEIKPDNKKIPKIRIVLEKLNDWFIATSIDEYGALCIKRGGEKDKVLEKCKEDTKDMLDGECEFEISEVY